MPDAIKLDPKTTAFIIIDMVNAIAKGGPGPDTRYRITGRTSWPVSLR